MDLKIPFPLMTPKARFMQSELRRSNHRELAASDQFTQSSDAALLQYCAELSNAITDTNSALACAYRLQGAFQFLRGFKDLSEMPPQPKPTQSTPQNLDHAN